MSTAPKNSFSTRSTLRVGNDSFAIYRLDALERAGIGKVSRLPFSLKVLLENLLRHEDDRFVHANDIRALAALGPLERSRRFRARNLVHAGARPASGFHRRSRRR